MEESGDRVLEEEAMLVFRRPSWNHPGVLGIGDGGIEVALRYNEKAQTVGFVLQ